jgi:hypothetical protein
MSDKVDKVSTGMLPIPGNLTSELLDEFDPEFVKWMIQALVDQGGPEIQTLRTALAGSAKFRRTVSAALHAMEQTNVAVNEGKRGPGEISLVLLLIICGWKLCEKAMVKVSESSAAT